MTVQEMHNAIKSSVQTFDAFTYDLLLPEQIDLVLNDMQNRFIKQRFYYKSNSKGVGFEETTKRLHDLQAIVATYSNSSLNTTTDHLYEDFPNHFLFYINGTVNLTYNGTTYNNVNLDIIPHEDINDLLRNPFRTTNYKNVLGSIQDSQISIYVKNKFILIGFDIVYLRTPQTISLSSPTINCELPDHTHNEIVDMAIQSILETMESPRYKTSINETITNE